MGLLLSACIVSLAAPASAQDADDPKQLDAEMRVLFQAGKYAEATPIAERALALRERTLGTDHADVGAAAGNLAILYGKLKRYGEAATLFDRALAIREKSVGPNHPSLVSLLHNRAEVARLQGKVDQREAILKRILGIADQDTTVDPRAVAATLNALAGIYYERRQYDEAEPLIRRSLAIREQTQGPDGPDVAPTLNNLAMVLEKLKRYGEAEVPLKQATAIEEKRSGPNDPSVALLLKTLGLLYSTSGRYKEAETAHRRSLAIWEAAKKGDHPDVVPTLTLLANVLSNLGRFKEAEVLYKRSLVINEAHLGAKDGVITDLNNLAVLYWRQVRYDEAERLYRRILDIYSSAGEDRTSGGATVLDNIARLYLDQGRYAEAESILGQSLDIRQKVGGEKDPAMTGTLSHLARLHALRSELDKAESFYRRSIAVLEMAYGADNPKVAESLLELANLFLLIGRYSNAEPLIERSKDIYKKSVGSDGLEMADIFGFAAKISLAKGNYAEAEDLLKRELAIKERAYGPSSPAVSGGFVSLGQVYQAQRRYDVAETFFKRAIAITEPLQHLGGHASTPTLGSYLANLYLDQRRYDEAEPLLEQALESEEKLSGPESIPTAHSLNNLAEVYTPRGRYIDAERLYIRALKILETRLGRDSLNVAAVRSNLAVCYTHLERFEEAYRLHMETLGIREKVLGPSDVETVESLTNIGALYRAQGNWARATQYLERAVRIMTSGEQSTPLAISSPGGSRKFGRLSALFWRLPKVAHRLYGDKKEQRSKLSSDMFEIAQWAKSSEVSESLSQMAARATKGDEKLAASVRERQDLVLEWQKREEIRTTALSLSAEKRVDQAELENEGRIGFIRERLKEIDNELLTKFPEYAALTSGRPVSVGDVQRVLGDNEAVVLFLEVPREDKLDPTPEESLIWVVTRDRVRWVRSKLGPSALKTAVQTLRCGLDPSELMSPEAWPSATDEDRRRIAEQKVRRDLCRNLLKTDYSPGDSFGPLPFDLGAAHALYVGLIGKVQDEIKGKHLLIVPSAALQGLPFQVLVTDRPKVTRPETAAGYRGAKWLALSNAVTILPSVSSLLALRTVWNKNVSAPEPYIGFGDPVLRGKCRPGPRFKSCPGEEQASHNSGQRKRDLAYRAPRPPVLDGISGGKMASVAAIRGQCPLPETALELRCVGKSLRAPDDVVFVGESATETKVKSLPLDRYRVLHFATHGVLAGEAESILKADAEPGLILTPPPEASEQDDGLLTASEVSALKLNADWVILSACNTAAGGKKGAEALSGLARAFFYAGARAILASHWYVNTEAGVKLVGGAFSELRREPRIGRAEALRRSMAQIISSDTGYASHPSYWAPFVVVGEGGAAR
jgi:tetratricopeptide (TPR) repeat protein/CHAT domain-containing protein